MSVYAYEVMDKSRRYLSGKLEADNEYVAASRLRKMGYTVTELQEIRQSVLSLSFSFKRKVTLGDLSLFSRQLATMLAAGIPLTRCLFALGEQASNPTLGNAVKEAARNVESGLSFSESIRAYPEVFSEMYVDMVLAGEVGGSLEEVLVRLSEQFERDKLLRDSIRAATFYPIAVLGFAVVAMVAMLFFIVPVFVGFFPPSVQMPAATRFVLALSNSLRGYWYACLLAMVALIFGVRMLVNSEAGQVGWDKIKFRLPVFGNLILKTTLARFARTFSTLLAGGIPVLQALDAAGPAAGSRQLTDATRLAMMRIQEGQSISAPLRESKLFPPMVTLMISVGEETGELAELLRRVAEFFEQEVATMAKGLTTMIEPLLIIFVGGIVGGIVVSLYLPMFTVITQFSR